MAASKRCTDCVCVCCGTIVPRSDTRRRLGGASSKLILPVFVDYFARVHPGATPLPPNFSEKSNLFWCRPCFSKLERVLKLKKDAQKVEEEILENIRCVGSQFLHKPAAATVQTTPKKRGPPPIREGEPSPKRRRPCGSTERRVLSRTVVTGTPSVSVRNKPALLNSVYLCCLHYHIGCVKRKKIFSCLQVK